MSHEDASSSHSPSHRSRRPVWAAAVAVLVITLSLVILTVTGPRVSVRWQGTIGTTDRLALEQSHELRNGRQDDDQNDLVWRYELGDWSREAVAALVNDPAVADTNYIDRSTYEVDDPTVTVTTRVPSILRLLPFPFSTDNRFESLWFFLHVQSLCLIVGGALLLRAAQIGESSRRRVWAIAAVLGVGILAYVLPLEPSMLRMGDANTYIRSPSNFEAYAGVRQIRYEAHLSHAILGRLYELFGRTADSPARALDTLMRLGTAWFLISALAVGFLERWSPRVVRYLGLVVLAPSALMYFGYRELGYLSLNVAAFPLILRGLQQDDRHLEAGSVVAGLGAALHGFGLLSLVGVWIAAVARRVRIADRAWQLLRILAWGTAAYIGWVAVYIIVLKLPIDPGHADSIPWRPWLVDTVGDRNRVNVPILSLAGGRDLLFTAWVVGAPLVVLVASLWRQYRDETRAALCYTIPSAAFIFFFWPIQGLGVEMDLIFAAFPAVYALAWVCAHDARRTTIAAALLVSAHLAFWRIALDTRFVNWTLF